MKSTSNQLDILEDSLSANYMKFPRHCKSEDISHDTLKCSVCDMIKKDRSEPVLLHDKGSEILILGNGPGQEEQSTLVPFSGRTGEFMVDMFKSLGVWMSSTFALSNVCLCYFGTREPPQEAIELCRPNVKRIVEIVKPKIILTLGLVAIQSISNIDDSLKMADVAGLYFNTIFDIKAFSIYHPAYIMRREGRRYKETTINHLREFIQHCRNNDIKISNYTARMRTTKDDNDINEHVKNKRVILNRISRVQL